MSRTRIKICGLREVEHVRVAVDAGVDALGLNFYVPSVRSVSVETAAKLRAAMPAFVSCVALFVNPDRALVERVIEQVKPDCLQFHGSESPEFCASFSRPYMKAAAVTPDFDLLNFSAKYATASALLLDTPSAGHGGSGHTFEWSLIASPLLQLQRQNASHRVVLSGGLHAANVATAIRALKPFAVDVSSGVEAIGAPKGTKDPTRIREFIAAVRAADQSFSS